MSILLSILWLFSLYFAFRVGETTGPDDWKLGDARYELSHLKREMRLLTKAHCKTMRKMKTYREFAIKNGYKPEKRREYYKKVESSNSARPNGSQSANTGMGV